MDLATTHAADPQALKVIFSSLVIICKIFYSLNFQVSYSKNIAIVILPLHNRPVYLELYSPNSFKPEFIINCHLYPLQQANCCPNSRLVVDEDDLKSGAN